MSRQVCLILMGFVGGVASLAGPPSRLFFRHLTPDQGLSSSSVTVILQDHKGFVWIGTYDGLNRYDGFTCTVYRNRPADSTSLPHNRVWTLLETQDKTLWIGTTTSLCRYDPRRDRFVDLMRDKFSPLRGQICTVRSLAQDDQGNLWIGTDNGLACYEVAENKVRWYRPDPNDPRSFSNQNVEALLVDRVGRIWAATWNGLNRLISKEEGFLRYGMKEMREVFFSSYSMTRMAEDLEGRLWIGTYGEGLIRMDPETGRMERFRHDPKDPSSLAGDRIMALYKDREGMLWVGTENRGLDRFDPTTGRFVHYQKDELDPFSLNDASIHAICQDQDGLYWIGTYLGGVNISRPNGEAIFTFRHLPGATASLSHDAVTAFVEDAEGRIWIGTDGGGLNRFDPKTRRFRAYSTHNSGLPSDHILCLLKDRRQRLWLGTWGGGLVRFDPGSGRFTAYTTQNSLLPDDNLYALAEGPDDRLWLATFQHGLVAFDPETGRIASYTTKNSPLSHDMTTALAWDGRSRLYVGTHGGFSVMDLQTRRFWTYHQDKTNPKGLYSEDIATILVKNDTLVWIGTQDGLLRFHPERQVFHRISLDEGLPEKAVKSLVLDAGGCLWIATNEGLIHYDPETGARRHFTREDGLQGNAFSLRAAYRLRNGALLFGGTNGFTLIYPDRLTRNTRIPPVLITGIDLFNRPLLAGEPGSPLLEPIFDTRALTLSHRQSMVTFHFRVMDLAIPEKNRYAYRLEGFDRDWRGPTDQRFATYTNLPPGKYRFRVKGAHHDGVWNEEGAALSLTMTPPFTQTWMFRMGVFLVIAGAVAGLFVWRIRRVAAEERRLEKKVAEQTAELSRTNEELHQFAQITSHELQEPIRMVTLYGELIARKLGPRMDDTLREYFDYLMDGARRLQDLANDLVGFFQITSHPYAMGRVDLNDALEQALRRLKEPIQERGAVVTHDLLPLVWADASQIVRVFENLVENAVRFCPKKPRIHVSAVWDHPRWIITVRDNGIGIDPRFHGRIFELFKRLHHRDEYPGRGMGLAVCKKIIELHGGNIWVESEVGKGATFYFSLPEEEEKRPHGRKYVGMG